jgi:hypothetical protein
VAPDSPVPHRTGTVQCSVRYDSVAHYSARQEPLQSTVALDSRYSAVTPVSPVNYSGPDIIREWLVGLYTVLVHRTLSGGTPDSPVRQTRAHSVSLLL